jgi:hypothetical protein
LTLADLIRRIATLPVAHQPGSLFDYGMSSDVLGRIVEVASGIAFDRFLAERITGRFAWK